MHSRMVIYLYKDKDLYNYQNQYWSLQKSSFTIRLKWLVYLTYSTICYKYSKLFLLTRSFRCECSYRAQVTEIANENYS